MIILAHILGVLVIIALLLLAVAGICALDYNAHSIGETFLKYYLKTLGELLGFGAGVVVVLGIIAGVAFGVHWLLTVK